MNECYVGGYWYGRAEPKESCVNRAHQYFEKLAACDEVFGSWFGTGDTVREALSHEIRTDPDSLHKEFKSECYGPNDETQRLHAWNGALFGQGAVCDLYCGGAGIWTTSVALLRLPDRGPSSERLRTLSSFHALTRMLIEVWEPEWAVATSDELRDSLLTKDELPRPCIGWLTYVSRSMAPTLPPLEGATVEAFADGHLIALAESHPPEISPELVETARRIDAHLRSADLLTSTRERAKRAP